MKYPQSSHPRIIGTRARALVPSKLNTEHWEYHEHTGPDVGIDLTLELIENNEFKNKKVDCQIKGTGVFNEYFYETYISYPFDVKTLNYGFNGRNPFVLFLVDVEEEKVYYVSLKDYVNKNRNIKQKLENNTATVNIRIPVENVLSMEDDALLCSIANESF